MSKRFNFTKEIVAMNVMYRLPVAAVPTVHAEYDWQDAKFPNFAGNLIAKRVMDFFGEDGILPKELKEHTDLLQFDDASLNSEEKLLDFLVMLADLLGDIQVYCASEMERFGIPNEEVLRIIMESNKSKLDENGNPIYDAQGKFLKGPNYWKPEPQIRELLKSLREAHRNSKGNTSEPTRS